MPFKKLSGRAAWLYAALASVALAPVTLAVPAAAQISFGISVNIAPPPLPVYVQPALPEPGYIWTPGYWAWDDDDEDYYWVPGAWVAPPRFGLLWTPGYWSWNDGVYMFRPGYWDRTVGFYGGVNYGYGYTGSGYYGGEWRNNQFYYNRSVNNVTNVNVTNVYNKTVIVNNNAPRTSFNGGPKGVPARPTPAQIVAVKAAHVPPTVAQVQHVTAAKTAPDAHFKANQGKPVRAVVEKPLGSAPVAEKTGGAQPTSATPGKPERQAPPGRLAMNCPNLPGLPPWKNTRPL